MRRSGYSEYVLKESEALVQGSIGCVGRFVLVRLLVAPFHYAKDKCFDTHPNSTAPSIA